MNMSQNIEKALDGIIDAIKTIVDNRMNEGAFDITKNAKITQVLGNNTYNILLDNNTYEKIKSNGDTSYNTNDIVKVMIPQNNPSMMFILGGGGSGTAAVTAYGDLSGKPQINSITLNGGNNTITTANIPDSTDKRYITDAQATKINNTIGTNTGDETATSLGSKIYNATEKSTPVDTDTIAISDSSASNVLKKLSWFNAKTTLKTYLDTLYAAINHAHTVTNITDFDTGVGNNADVSANTSARHSHTNKAILDNTTASFTTAEQTKLSGIESGAEVNNISDVNATDLTDAGDTSLHYHSADRNRANHTGTQLAATVSDFAATVRTTVLTGLSTATNAVVLATDTILVAIGKLQKQISDHISDAVAHITAGERTTWNAKLDASTYTASDVLTKIKTVDGTGSGLDSDLLEGQHGAYYLDWANTTNKPDPVITLDGDLSGSGTMTDLGNVIISATVADNSHNHIASNISDFDTEVSNNTDVAANTTARHTHTNKAILDATTASFTTADETKLDGIEAGAEVNNISDVNATDLTDGGETTLHTHNGENISQTIYTTTTAVTEGWYRIATIPIGTQFKQSTFRIKGYTATGTTTESKIDINLGYYSGNYTSQVSAITCNTSHSFNAQTNAENGWVFLYCRVSFDATSAYIDMYKYKTTAVTMEVQPLTLNDWVWATGALTVNPTVGAYRNATAMMGAGLYGNNIYASSSGSSGSSGSSTYSNYGVLGTHTLSNTTNKTGQWAYFGSCTIDYNSSYLGGRSLNIRCRLQEMSYDGTVSPNEMDDFALNIQVNLGYHADGAAFNALVPTFDMNIEGQTSLTVNDVCGLVYSTSTTQKVIRFYVKLKAANTVYGINPEQRYGRAFATSTYAQTTSYIIFSYAGDQAPIVSLPAPAQGSVVYPKFKKLNSPALVGVPTAPTATAGTNTTQIATTEFVQSAMASAGAAIIYQSTEPTEDQIAQYWYRIL